MKPTHQRPIRKTPVPENVIRTQWRESLSLCGPYPTSLKRFYKLETLTHALEKALMVKDRFLHTGLQTALGDAPLSTVSGDLVFEDECSLVFSLMAGNRARKRCSLRLVIAKNHEECTAALERSCMNLLTLSKRGVKQALAPLRTGSVFLPDRHMRKEINREVFACLFTAPPSMAPLYVASSTQLAPRGTQPLTFSKANTELIKKSFIQLVAACYDEEHFVGVDPCALSPSDISLANATTGTLTLLQCPRFQKRLRSAALIRKLLFSTLETGKHILPMAPAHPDHFFSALIEATSKETARAWCAAFLERKNSQMDLVSRAREVELPGRAYIQSLENLVSH